MATGKMTDPMNTKIGQDQTKVISKEGKAEIVEESSIDVMKPQDLGNVVELEKFMQEPVEVLVYEPFEAGQERVVQLAVNGRNQFVIRGVSQMIKRKYVEVLARARKVNVSADGYKDPTGEAKNSVRISSGLQYPFQVIMDKNPKGPSWLKQILAEV